MMKVTAAIILLHEADDGDRQNHGIQIIFARRRRQKPSQLQQIVTRWECRLFSVGKVDSR